MGISSLHINSPDEGTVRNTILYLNNERVTGTLCFSFGDFIPDAVVHLLVGIVVDAEFGDLKGKSVLDFLMCQEQGVKEIDFVPGSKSRFERGSDEEAKADDILLKTTDVAGLLSSVARDVEGCEARPFIYAPLPIDIEGASLDSLLRIFYAFEKHKTTLASVQLGSGDAAAPLPQCALIRAALTRDVLCYRAPLVALTTFRDLFELLKPMDNTEAENLTGYMRSLIPHSRANYMVLESFYAFASEVESIAYRRGKENGEEARRIIYRIIAKAQGDKRI